MITTKCQLMPNSLAFHFSLNLFSAKCGVEANDIGLLWYAYHEIKKDEVGLLHTNLDFSVFTQILFVGGLNLYIWNIRCVVNTYKMKMEKAK